MGRHPPRNGQAGRASGRLRQLRFPADQVPVQVRGRPAGAVRRGDAGAPLPQPGGAAGLRQADQPAEVGDPPGTTHGDPLHGGSVHRAVLEAGPPERVQDHRHRRGADPLPVQGLQGHRLLRQAQGEGARAALLGVLPPPAAARPPALLPVGEVLRGVRDGIGLPRGVPVP